MHGCRKEAGNTAERIIPDYYLTTTAKSLGSLALQGFRGFFSKWRKFVRYQPNRCAAMPPGFFCNSLKNCPNPTKPLGPNGFLFDRLMTPTLKAAGSNPVGRTKMNDPT